MLDFDEARRRLLSDVRPGPVERLPLIAARGRVLAEDLVARTALPSFDGSAMDGYAVATQTFAGDGPWALPIVGESRTGRPPPRLLPGTACRIFTGAIVPEGADAVVMQEDVAREGEIARFDAKPRPWANVRRAGEDLAEGAIALPRGTRLGPAQIGLAATLDRGELLVARRPVVTVLATGDELRPPGSAPRDASIPESNGPALVGLIESAGAVAHLLPATGDDEERTRAAIEDALRSSDVLVTIGGVSVGDHDVVKPALEAAGVTLDFWKVAMKPGKPLMIGRIGEALYLGLPGNPVAAFVCWHVIGARIAEVSAGITEGGTRRMIVRAGFERVRQPGRCEFLPVRLGDYDGHGVRTVAVTALDVSHRVALLAQADGLLLIPSETDRIRHDDMLEFIPFGDGA